MFHYFVGDMVNYGDDYILKNDSLGIEVEYQGLKSSGEFFLYPYFNQNNNSYNYLAFETFKQKRFFEKLHKVPGIGPKTAYNMSMKPFDKTKEAVENGDVKFFQSIKGIGPKTSKRIVVELKSNLDSKDFEKLAGNEQLYNNIVNTLKPLGYKVSDIKKAIDKIDIELKKSNLQKIVKQVVSVI